MTAPAVSIVLPFFNGERFLRETLDSVFAQTLTDWQLLLVDDGSTDSSTATALECAKQCLERVRYIEHAGHAKRGVAASRNAGIEQARAEWIALLDADDVWLPEKLKSQLAASNRYQQAELIFSRAEYWRSWQGGVDDIPDLEGLAGIYEPPQLLLATILGDIAPPPPSDVLVRRELWRRVGGFEPALPDLYEDQVFLAKCFAAASAFVVPETFTRYRRHSDSLESRAGIDAEFAYGERIRFLRWLDLTFAEHPSAEVRSAVRRFTWAARNPRLHRHLWRTRRVLTSP